MKDNYFKHIIDKFMRKIIESIIEDFKKGSLSVSPNEELEPTKEQIKLMSGKIYENIKGVTDEDSKKINNIIRDSLLARESRVQIAKKLDDVFKGDNPTKLSYKKRLKLISRTESVRFYNQGAFTNAKRLGATKKYISIVNDNRTSPQSKMFDRKYGSPDKAIGIDEEFSINYKGVTYKGLYSPFLPNDRDSIIYIFE
jgi:hypothetical protein